MTKLVQDALTQAGKGFQGFFDSLSEEDWSEDFNSFVENLSQEDFGKDVTDFFNNVDSQSGGFFSGLVETVSHAFDGSSMWADEYAMSQQQPQNPPQLESTLESEPADEIPKSTTVVEKISYVRDENGYTSSKTVKTTKQYADGRIWTKVENLPVPILHQDSSITDIMTGYKDVIETVTPKMLKLSEDMTKNLTSAFDEMFNKFENKMEDIDNEEECLDFSNVSKEELLQDYEDFSSSYEELENVGEIGESEDVSKKFDKLADNFAKVMKFAWVY